jgi:hypothetical protein
MDWIDGNSSNIARFKYDVSSQVLTVEFINGGAYNYYDIPDFIFDEMRRAGSRGQFLAQRIKGAYRYARA